MTNEDKILKALKALQADVSTVKNIQQDHTNKLDNLETHVSTLKTDVSTLKTDTTTLKSDTSMLKDGQAHTNTALEALDNKLDVTTRILRQEIKQHHKPRQDD